MADGDDPGEGVHAAGAVATTPLWSDPPVSLDPPPQDASNPRATSPATIRYGDSMLARAPEATFQTGDCRVGVTPVQ
jgi:hypothetical protein